MAPRPARLPPPVLPGARVGVAALSGYVDPAALTRGLAGLVSLGFEPVPAGNLGSRWGVFAGGDAERLAAFHALAADPSLAAIFFARGGYGLPRLLPGIDWDLLAAVPRAYVGYSDVTPFLLQVVARLGLVAFHGPMVASDLARGLGGEEVESLLACLAGRLPRVLPVPLAIRAGEAEGVLLGGCLSLLAAVTGTPWQADLTGSILFLEDIGEPAYRIDRMLTHLHLSGSLAALHGLVLGDLGEGWRDGAPGAWQLEAVRQVEGPVGAGLPCGHTAPNLTLPLGVRAVLDVAGGRLELLSER